MKDQDFKGMNPFQILLRTKKWFLHLTMTLSILGCLTFFGVIVFLVDSYQNPTPKNTITAWQFWFGVVSFAVGIFALWAVIGGLLKIYAENASRKVDKIVARGSEELNQIESELATADKSGLVPLLRYSRVQLEAYYRMGLTQTQRSFRHSVIAMWIGFAVIVGGLVVRIFDLTKFGLIRPDANLGMLVIASGAIIEVISALFLWVYRTSIRQLTYFYNRQIYNHSVLISQRIAETMTSSDDIKKVIIEKLLDRSWALDLDALPSARHLLSGAQSSNKT